MILLSEKKAVSVQDVERPACCCVTGARAAHSKITYSVSPLYGRLRLSDKSKANTPINRLFSPTFALGCLCFSSDLGTDVILAAASARLSARVTG